MSRESNARFLGAVGEAIAERYLVDSGLIFLERNWRCDAGEIDLIFKAPRPSHSDSRELGAACEFVFVEVKTRSSGRFGIGSEAITAEKYRRLHRLATLWCKARGVERRYRIDVISIDGLVLPEVTHIERVIL